jgi:uroporphyrin-III C-methyltransferase
MDKLLLPRPKRRYFLHFLLLLIVLGIAAYAYWRCNIQKNQFATVKLQQLQTLVAENQSHTTELQQGLIDLKGQLQQQQQTLTNLQNLLQHNNASDEDWTLAQVQYLLRIAHLTLNYAKDPKTAMALLQSADRDLRNFNDPSLDNLRQFLAADLLKLQQASAVDITGILARLNALQQEIVSLPLQTPKLNTPTLEKQTKGNWQQGLQSSLQSLQQIVIIRHNDQAIVPLLSPEQRFYLELNLQILLQKAQLAALQGQAEIYQSNLQSASDWIKRYYLSNANASQGILTTLAQLQQTPINPSLPDLTTSLDAVQKVITQRHVVSNKQEIAPQ